MSRKYENMLRNGDTVTTLRIWTEKAFANNVDPEQTPQNAASDQGLHSLPYIQQYFRPIIKLSICTSYHINLVKRSYSIVWDGQLSKAELS